MTVRAVLSRHALAVFIVIVFLFSRASTRAANLSLAWNPSESSTVTGYDVFYGLVGKSYISNFDVGTNTSIVISSLTPGATYYFVVLAYSAGGESPFSNKLIDTIPPLPSIAGQPSTQAIMAGATATFIVSAAASGESLTYQW